MNRALNTLNTKIAACEEKFKKIPAGNPAKPMQGLTSRMKKKGKYSEEMAVAYKEYAGKIRAINTLNADPRVLKITINESEHAQQCGDTCHEISMQMTSMADLGLAEALELQSLCVERDAGRDPQRARGLAKDTLPHLRKGIPHAGGDRQRDRIGL